MSARAERRAMIALVAVFALLVQALIPTLAMAAASGDPAMVICTAKGLQAAPAGGQDPGQPADHACQHCLCPAISTAASPSLEIIPVAYIVAAAPRALTAQAQLPPARGPPRPPGQGPPLSQA
jgi:hypothetical protein